MLFYLFLAFTLVPIIELSLLVWIGGQTAWWVPIAVVIITGILGAALARWQGWQAVQRIREEAKAGRVPTQAIIDGVLIFIAGLLLVTPGVLSDLTGIALLIPPIRALVKRGVAAWIRKNVEVQIARSTAAYSSPGGASFTPRPNEIIDARVIRTQVHDAE